MKNILSNKSDIVFHRIYKSSLVLNAPFQEEVVDWREQYFSRCSGRISHFPPKLATADANERPEIVFVILIDFCFAFVFGAVVLDGGG